MRLEIKYYIRLFRLKRKMTTKTLSDLSGVSQSTIKELEQRRKRDISIDAILKLAKALEVDFELLFKCRENDLVKQKYKRYKLYPNN